MFIIQFFNIIPHDLSALNENNKFERCYKEIYPPELELKKEKQEQFLNHFAK